MDIDNKLKEIYKNRYPLNKVAKEGWMDKDPIQYIHNYENEVLNAIKGRAVGKSNIEIIESGVVSHRKELDATGKYSLEKNTFNLSYIRYKITAANGDEMFFDKEFLLHQIGKRSDYWVRGTHLYIAPIVSDSVMHRKPDGRGILTRFRREKQIISPLNMKMYINNVLRNIVISYNEKPFKVITLSEKEGHSNKKKSPTILMSIYAKGLAAVLSKTYGETVDSISIKYDNTLANTESKNSYNLVVPEDTDYTTVRGVKNTGVYFVVKDDIKLIQLATAILHTIDLNPILIEMVKDNKVNWEPKSQWNTMLAGKSIFHDTIPLSSINHNLSFHEQFVSAYMIDTIRAEFKRIGYDFEDIYDYYSTVFYEYDSIMHSNVLNKVTNNKRIESMYYLYSEIINKVNKEFEHALKDLSENNVARAAKRIKGTIFRNSNISVKSGRSLAIYPYTSIGDVFPLTVGTITSLQEMGNGNDKAFSKEVSIESVKDVKPMDVFLGNAYGISNSNLNPIMSHNPYMKYSLDDGTPILDLDALNALNKDIAKLYL